MIACPATIGLRPHATQYSCSGSRAVAQRGQVVSDAAIAASRLLEAGAGPLLAALGPVALSLAVFDVDCGTYAEVERCDALLAGYAVLMLLVPVPKPEDLSGLARGAMVEIDLLAKR